MILIYKKEIHKDETDSKNTTVSKSGNKFRINFKEMNYCCELLKQSMDLGFIVIKNNNHDNMFLKYDQRIDPKLQPDQPYFAMMRGEPTIFDEGGMEEQFCPINRCPFCGNEFLFYCAETKEIIHKCKKETRTEEVCTPYIEEKIIE